MLYLIIYLFFTCFSSDEISIYGQNISLESVWSFSGTPTVEVRQLIPQSDLVIKGMLLSYRPQTQEAEMKNNQAFNRWSQSFSCLLPTNQPTN